MKTAKLFVLSTLITLTFFVPTARAYEGIFHYAWTYYLALQVGFTERQAYQIASATNALDWDSETNPIASPLDSIIDTAFGGERFRYFDLKLNELWVDLRKEMKKTPSLERKDQYTTLRKLRKVRGEEEGKHSPAKLLKGTWQKYYNALVERNPAIRTWVKLHAFQPIVLQKHHDIDSDFQADFSTIHTDEISLDTPLASFQQSHQGRILPNARSTWLLASQLLTRPNTAKNGGFSQLDADTFDLFQETLNFCGKESMKVCLCESPNELAKNLAAIQTNDSSGLELPLIEKKDFFSCDGKISIVAIHGLIQKISRVLDHLTKLSLTENNRSVQDNIHRWALQTRIYDKISLLPFLAHIQPYQEKTAMSWSLIYSALMRDIETYLLNEYWDPKDPDKLQELHAPTIAVNAVRGESAGQLFKLAQHDRNPGPLLHYIQDLHSHGPYNTYHGHATVNHLPDFIDQDSFNPVDATIDTIIILCEFKNFLDKLPTENQKMENDYPLFVGKRSVKSTLCEKAALDEKAAREKGDDTNSELRKYLFLQPPNNNTETPLVEISKQFGKELLKILKQLGKESNIPTTQKARVTAQAAQKLLQPKYQGFEKWLQSTLKNPAHKIKGDEGDEGDKFTDWTNEEVGLPDFPAAVRYLNTQVSSARIPVWKKGLLRLEDNLRFEDQVVADTGLKQHMDSVIKVSPDWKWKPTGIPTHVIQYDYDYCGRVVKGDMGWITYGDHKEVKSIGTAISCNQPTVGEKATEPTNPVQRATNALYEVENISVDISNISMERFIEKLADGRIVNTAKWEPYLEYTISGVVPGLNGDIPIRVTKPKSILKKQTGVFLPEGSTDMWTTTSKINHGPDHLPILEVCQLLLPNSDEIKKEMNSIIDGTFLKGDKKKAEKAADKVYDYLFKKPDPSQLRNLAVLYRARRDKTDGSTLQNTYSTKGSAFINFLLEESIQNASEVFLACSVQVQGLPPVVAMRNVSRGVTLQVNGHKQGPTRSE